LKKIFYIFILFFTLSNIAFGQNRTALDPTVTNSRFIRFYPNPATAVINFDFQKGYSSNYTLLIFNFMGKKIYELKNTPSRININLEDFYRGIYIYQLRNQNGAILESGKFQVVK